MHHNLHYFEYSKTHPEPLFDPYYEKNLTIIPPTAQDENELTKNNQRLIDLITAFQVTTSIHEDPEDAIIKSIIQEVKDILDHTKCIHLSAFCQFFMVQNSSYLAYRALSDEAKDEFLYAMLVRYCKERHEMYKSHGYSDMILQVVCDSYSHKRNCNTSILKFKKLLEPYITYNISDEDQLLTEDNYYFLPDKTGRRCFERLLADLNLKMESRLIEQNKVPDFVFKHNGHYYIFELKMMKGGGGGQNKQAVEFAYFIKFTEENPYIHYGVLLDSLYANDLFENQQPKIAAQRKDVIKALKDNPRNYFVNTAGAELLLQDIFS